MSTYLLLQIDESEEEYSGLDDENRFPAEILYEVKSCSGQFYIQECGGTIINISIGHEFEGRELNFLRSFDSEEIEITICQLVCGENFQPEQKEICRRKIKLPIEKELFPVVREIFDTGLYLVKLLDREGNSIDITSNETFSALCDLDISIGKLSKTNTEIETGDEFIQLQIELHKDLQTILREIREALEYDLGRPIEPPIFADDFIEQHFRGMNLNFFSPLPNQPWLPGLYD